MPEITEAEKARRAAELATILQSRGSAAPIPSDLVGATQDSGFSYDPQARARAAESLPNSTLGAGQRALIQDYNQNENPLGQIQQGYNEGNPRKLFKGVTGLVSPSVTGFAGPLAGTAINSAAGALGEGLPSNQEKGIDTSHVDLKSAFGSKDFNHLSLTDQKKTLAAGIPGLDTLSNDDYLLWREHEGFPLEGARRHTIFDTALNLARPMIAGAVGGAANKLLPGIGGKLAGAAAYTLTDAIAQHVQNNAPSSLVSQIVGVEPGTLADTLLSTGEQAGVGKLFEKIAKNVGTKIKGAANRDEVLETMGVSKKQIEDFDKLQPTYAQYYQRIFGTKAKVSQVLEDTFNATAKGKLLQAAESKAVNGVKDQALKGTPEVDPHLIADDVAAMAQENLHKSVQYSNAEANNVHEIAQQNTRTYQPAPPKQVQGPNQMILEGFDPTGGKAIPPVEVAGPIRLFNTKSKIGEIEQSLENIPPEDPQLGPMRNVLGALKARMSQEDVNGETIPLGFKEAWELSKMYGRSGWENKRLAGDSPAPTTFMGGNYRKLWSAITEDIKDSIPTWEQDGGKALGSFQNAKQAVRDRNTIFSENGLYDIINERGTRIPHLDQALKDPKVLENVLQGSELKLPNGTVEMTNARKTIGGYALNKILETSTSQNPLTGGTQEFNSQKFYDQWSDPKFAQVKDKLFSKDVQASIGELVKNTAAMQQGAGAGYAGAKTKMVNGGLALGSTLTAGLSPHYGLAVGVISLSAYGIAKALSNPTLAKILIANSKGAPLSVSQETAARIFSQVMNGVTMTATSPDGSEHPVKMDKGKIIPY